jgi:dTDP-4-amino-4,6-dideoxygalactose transaminase
MYPIQGDHSTTRRDFLKTTGGAGAGLYLAAATPPVVSQPIKQQALALNGGTPAVTLTVKDATRWPLYGAKEIEEVGKLIANPNYLPVAEFEEAWKAYHGCPYAKAHCNGTSALTSMWFALDLPAGSEVLVADYSTCFPVVPMRFFDLVPVFVDVDPRTMNIDVEDCRRRLTPKTRAILAVHWWGVPCEMDAIEELAKEHDLVVVEDASHAHGARVKDTLVGNWGRIAGFSLQCTKPLPAIEGGIANYKIQDDFERATTYGNYDLPKTFPEGSPYRKYQGTALGSKLRMHPASAILAKIQLGGLDARNGAASERMGSFNERLCQLPGLTCQYSRPDIKRVYYSSNLMFIDEKKAGMSRNAAVEALKAEGAEVTEYSWTLLHTYPAFQESEWWRAMPVLPEPSTLPGCDEANRTAISVPYFTTQQPELMEQYVAAFEKVWAHRDSLGKV